MTSSVVELVRHNDNYMGLSRMTFKYLDTVSLEMRFAFQTDDPLYVTCYFDEPLNASKRKEMCKAVMTLSIETSNKKGNRSFDCIDIQKPIKYIESKGPGILGFQIESDDIISKFIRKGGAIRHGEEKFEHELVQVFLDYQCGLISIRHNKGFTLGRFMLRVKVVSSFARVGTTPLPLEMVLRSMDRVIDAGSTEVLNEHKEIKSDDDDDDDADGVERKEKKSKAKPKPKPKTKPKPSPEPVPEPKLKKTTYQRLALKTKAPEKKEEKKKKKKEEKKKKQKEEKKKKGENKRRQRQ